MEKTGRALVDHWQWAGSKGLMNSTTARLIRNACQQVHSAQEEWENLDVESIDPEEIFRRFQNLHGRNLTPDSLRDYRRRFVQGVQMFLDYVRDPSNWKSKTDRPRRPEVGDEKKPKNEGGRQKLHAKQPQKLPRGDEETLMDYPFPIRTGIIARLHLPGDLTCAEAKRLANFFSSLAVDTGADAVEIGERHAS
jgi:hypothetical protein